MHITFVALIKKQIPLGKPSNENTISQLLLNLLQEFGHIRITGLGHFQLRKIPAVLDSSTHVLRPPSEVADFRIEGGEGAMDFLDLLEAEQMVKPKLLKNIRGVLNAKISEFLNLGTVHIEGIGTIKEMDAGKWSVEEFNQLISDQNQFLPQLTLSPLGTAHVPASQKTLGVTQKLKVPEIIYNDIDDRGKGIPWEKLIGPALIFAIGIGSIIGLSRLFKPKSSEIKLEAQEEIGFWSDSLMINYKYRGYLTWDVLESGCAIVIGSFDNQDNADLLRSSAIEKGYTADVIMSANNRRVVVQFDCNEYDLRSFLDQVRSAISEEAWYLIPAIEEAQL